MRRPALWALLFGVGVFPAHAAEGDQWTPLGVAHQSPLRILFLQLPPEPPTLLPAGALAVIVRASYTNTSLREIQPGIAAELDLEQYHPTLAMEYGATDWLQVGAELPFGYSWEGFLDPVIREVEETTGHLRFVRRTQPTNGFRYLVVRDGRSLVDVERGAAGIGDLVLKAKGRLSEESRLWPAMSLRAAVKLPTGRLERGLGSERSDAAVGIVAGKRWGRVGVALSGEWTWPLGNPFSGTGIGVRPWATGAMTADLGITDRLSAFGILRYVGSPYRHSGLRLLDRRIWETVAGLNIALSRGAHLQVGFIEDLDSSEVSSDFTFFVNLIAHRF